MSIRLSPLLVVVSTAALLASCAPIARPQFVEVEFSGLPENPAAVRLGQFKSVVQDHGRGQAEVEFELGGQRFKGHMQTIDESVTTSGKSATTQRSAAVAVSGGSAAAARGVATQNSANVSTTTQGSSKGVATLVSERGVTMTCDYVVNNRQYTGTGTCETSTGAKYRVFAKPIRVVMTDGSSRAM